MNPLNEGYRPVLEQDKLITQKNILKICQYVLAKDPSTYVSPWKQTDRSTVVQWAETFYFYFFFFFIRLGIFKYIANKYTLFLLKF